ncbi:MAG: hypothetical protein AAGK78_11640, partial [Planctomycetota bacterium]
IALEFFLRSVPSTLLAAISPFLAFSTITNASRYKNRNEEWRLQFATERYEQVASFVRCGHAGVFFHPPTFTNRGAAPTKSGEMLACGLPLAGNLVGDVPDVLERSKVGVALRTFDDDALEAAAASLARLSKLPDIAQRARQTAERWFSLDRAIDGYDQIYQTVSVGAAGGRVDDRRWPASASAQQVANA